LKGTEKMDKLPVVIVTFFPKERLLTSVFSLQEFDMISNIIIIDNTGEENDIVNKLYCFSKVQIIKNETNKGIASAQNKGLDMAYALGFKWAVTLDHDTIASKKLFEKYINYISQNDCNNVGIICTDYFDIGVGAAKYNNTTIIEVQETISSGTIINLSVFSKIGKMKESYFIDQVDNEYCYRLQKKGYKILLLPGLDMEHKLGNITCKKVLGHDICIYNQAPIRTFYRTRNIIFMMREYKDKKMHKDKKKILCDDLVRIMFEKNKVKKIIMYIRGIWAGFHGSYK